MMMIRGEGRGGIRNKVVVRMVVGVVGVVVVVVVVVVVGIVL